VRVGDGDVKRERRGEWERGSGGGADSRNGTIEKILMDEHIYLDIN
jgi:hypothetical protein